MRQNQDLQYFIDIHRDSQRRDKTTTTIDGKPYARISFVIGTAHDNWEQNLKLARQLHNKMESLYPGLSKGVFLKNRATGNGEYNQSLSPRSILVEIGGVDNNFDEVFRTTKALARAFADLYFQTEPVNAKSSAPGSQ
jgi:stage II sporulation protein P